MGVRLSLEAADRLPQWTLICDGVDFLMRPAMTAEYRAAESAASERLRLAILGAETLADMGIPVPDAEEISDESLMLGFSRELMAVELALRIVSEWRGVWLDDEDEPAELNSRNLAAFLRDPLRHQAFESAAYRRIGALASEGKG